MKNTILVVFFIFQLYGCAQIQMDPPKLPYDGLTKTSYGPLSVGIPKECDGQDIMLIPGYPEYSSGRIAQKITDWLATPIKPYMTVDERIKKEDMQNDFLLPGDTGQASVAIMSRSDDEIVFWYSLGVVQPEEVASAAKRFCSSKGRTSLYEGFAHKCKAIKSPIVVQGKNTIVITEVIAAFKCKKS